MTSLREAVAFVRVIARRLADTAPAEAVHTKRALHGLSAPQDDRPRPPPENMLELLRRNLAQLFGAARGHEATRRQLCHAPWILWNGQPRGEAIPGLLDAVLDQAAEHRRTLRHLVHCWIVSFDPESASHRRIARELERLVRRSDDPRLAWARIAASEVSLFDATSGPNCLGHVLLTSSTPVEELSGRYGFAEPLRAASAYLKHALLAVLREWRQLASQKDALQFLDRLLALWTLDDGGRRRLRFDELRGAFAGGLLRPWLDGIRPAEDVRARVQRALLDRLGDPRVPGGSGRWAQVDRNAVDLFKSWLAKASLETFFQIIRHYALDRQWRYRERFWKACLDKGAISDVWLALAHEVKAAARLVQDLRGSYGTLSGGVDAKHAVILMRIGPLVLCEWSHNGRLRAWPADWKHAPQLGRSAYTGYELKTDSLVFPGGGKEDGLRHAGSDSGRWQDRAAALLRERAGVRLETKDYLP